jgi:hypothetical protein
MLMGGMKSKRNSGFVQRKRLETGADTRLKKEFLYVYNLYAAYANALEKTLKPAGTLPHERREAHLDRSIVSSETWSERDKLYRRLASHCYQNARWFEKNGDYKQASKWMNLALRFLRLSLDPKAKQDYEAITKKLDEIKALQQTA